MTSTQPVFSVPHKNKPLSKITVVEPSDVSSAFVLPEDELRFFVKNGSSDLKLRHYVSCKPEHTETISGDISRLEIRNDKPDPER